MGSSGKGGGSGTDLYMVAGENAYNTALSGGEWNPGWDTYKGGRYVNALKQGWDMGMEEKNATDMFMSMFEGGGGGGVAPAPVMPEPPDPSIQGLNDRDEAYTEYLDYASRATDYVNQQINDEQSNAALMGVDYEMTDERKSARINEYFSTIWGEGNQTKLEGLFEEWGDPEGFEGFLVNRGNAGTSEPEPTGSTTKPVPPGGKTTLATEDTLDTKSILG